MFDSSLIRVLLRIYKKYPAESLSSITKEKINEIYIVNYVNTHNGYAAIYGARMLQVNQRIHSSSTCLLMHSIMMVNCTIDHSKYENHGENWLATQNYVDRANIGKALQLNGSSDNGL